MYAPHLLDTDGPMRIVLSARVVALWQCKSVALRFSQKWQKVTNHSKVLFGVRVQKSADLPSKTALEMRSALYGRTSSHGTSMDPDPRRESAFDRRGGPPRDV